MEIQYIGEDEFSSYELDHLTEEDIKGITDYYYIDRSGGGMLITIDKEGVYYKYDLGHCSCYGPLENGYSGKFTKEEILLLIDDYTSWYYKDNKLENIKEKFREFVESN